MHRDIDVHFLLFSVFVCRAQVFTGFSGHGNSIHNIIPLLKKENVHLCLCSWGYNNYTNVYSQSSWEDMALEVSMSSVKSMDVTCKTHSGWLTMQFSWLVNLASLVCNVNWWFRGRVLAQHSVDAGSISSGGYHGIYCWWGQNSCLVFLYVVHKCSPDFLVMVIQFAI